VAKTCLRAKAKRTPKYKVRAYTRCLRCGRPRGVYKKISALSHLFPEPRAVRRDPGGDQVELVESVTGRRLPPFPGFPGRCRPRLESYHYDNDRSDR